MSHLLRENLRSFKILVQWNLSFHSREIVKKKIKLSISKKRSNILAPLRRPLWDFSKAAFVTSLKAEARAPDAARPAKKDCRATKWKRIKLVWIDENRDEKGLENTNLKEFRAHERQISNHPTLNMSICNSETCRKHTQTNKSSKPTFPWCGYIQLSPKITADSIWITRILMVKLKNISGKSCTYN